ncbi:hypothetical protein F383_07871 [Gossypium arboreum]|uniref:Uncharacterized protein n=1 Tax=Gossypium arboreum TaxID=29729 RepID=A0A0B0PTV5_GOSAR|nr:hypothetical protein F383_07871 [Gossypium arboreum]
MASICNRFISRSSPFIKSAVRSNGPKSSFSRSAAAPSISSPLPSPSISPLRRFSSRYSSVHRSWDLCSHCCRYTAQWQWRG